MEKNKQATDQIDSIDIDWKKFKKMYWSILAVTVALVFLIGSLQVQLNPWMYAIIIVLPILGMIVTVSWFCFKLSKRRASLLQGLFGFLLFSIFPVAQMAIYFTVEKEYLHAKGLPVPKYIPILYWLGIVLGSIFLFGLIRSIFFS